MIFSLPNKRNYIIEPFKIGTGTIRIFRMMTRKTYLLFSAQLSSAFPLPHAIKKEKDKIRQTEYCPSLFIGMLIYCSFSKRSCSI